MSLCCVRVSHLVSYTTQCLLTLNDLMEYRRGAEGGEDPLLRGVKGGSHPNNPVELYRGGPKFSLGLI